MKAHIPNPCTEKYENMSPTKLGKMCKVCNTEVVDFTDWDTKDIFEYIQKSDKKVCGNLKPTLTNESYSFRKINLLAISTSFLLFTNFNTAKAVDKTRLNTGIPIEYALIEKNNYQDTVLIKFVNLANVPLSNVVVKIPNTEKYFISDEDGVVRLSIEKDTTYKLKIYYIGYNSKIININSQNQNNITKITLEESDDTIGEVVIKSPFSLRKRIKSKIERFLNFVNVRDDN